MRAAQVRAWCVRAVRVLRLGDDALLDSLARAAAAGDGPAALRAEAAAALRELRAQRRAAGMSDATADALCAPLRASDWQARRPAPVAAPPFSAGPAREIGHARGSPLSLAPGARGRPGRSPRVR